MDLSAGISHDCEASSIAAGPHCDDSGWMIRSVAQAIIVKGEACMKPTRFRSITGADFKMRP